MIIYIEKTGMFGTLTGLYFFHRRTREQEREKRTQYWREQVCLLAFCLKSFSLTLIGRTPFAKTFYKCETLRRRLYSPYRHMGADLTPHAPRFIMEGIILVRWIVQCLCCAVQVVYGRPPQTTMAKTVFTGRRR